MNKHNNLFFGGFILGLTVGGSIFDIRVFYLMFLFAFLWYFTICWFDILFLSPPEKTLLPPKYNIVYKILKWYFTKYK